MSWNHIKSSKQQVITAAKTLQAAGRPGDFIIRAGVSAEVLGALGITLVSARGKLLNYLIDPTPTRELQVRGSDAAFRSAQALVDYYAERKRHPLPVRLNADDGGQEETFGFGSDSDDSAVKYDEVASPTSPVYGSIAAGGGGGGPPDALTINMLRKQAELLAARRRAAEVNVKLLAAQQNYGSPGGGGGGGGGEGGGSTYNTLSRAGMSSSQLNAMQSETRAQAEAQMADMQNAGLLAGWKAQLAELDRLRSLSPEGGQLMAQIEQQRRERILKIEALKGRAGGGGATGGGGGSPNRAADGAGSMAAVLDPSVSKLYDDIGVYTTRAKAAREAEIVIEKEESELLAEEMQLREEELKLQREGLIISNIAQSIKELIFGIGDQIVVEKAIADQREKQAELENRLADAEADRQDKERRLHEIGSMMRPLAGILSAPQGAYGQAGPSYGGSYGGPSMQTYEQLQRPGGKPSWKQQQQQQQQQAQQGGSGGQVQYGGAPAPQTNQWWKHGRTATAAAAPRSSAPQGRRASYDRQSFDQGSPPRRSSFDMPATTGNNFNSYGGQRAGRQSVSPQAPGRSWKQRRGSASNNQGGGAYGGSGDLYARIPGDASSDEDAPTAPAWRNNLSTTRGGGGGGAGRRYSSDRLPQAPAPAAFSVVKYSKRGGGGGNDDFGGDGDQDEECTHLGNCTCPSCR